MAVLGVSLGAGFIAGGAVLASEKKAEAKRAEASRTMGVVSKVALAAVRFKKPVETRKETLNQQKMEDFRAKQEDLLKKRTFKALKHYTKAQSWKGPKDVEINSKQIIHRFVLHPDRYIHSSL